MSDSTEPEEIFHYATEPHQPVCGSNGPLTTAYRANVTCPVCLEKAPRKTPRIAASTESEMIAEVLSRIGRDEEDSEGLLKNLAGRVRLLERDRCVMIVAENRGAGTTLDAILRPSTARRLDLEDLERRIESGMNTHDDYFALIAECRESRRRPTAAEAQVKCTEEGCAWTTAQPGTGKCPDGHLQHSADARGVCATGNGCGVECSNCGAPPGRTCAEHAALRTETASSETTSTVSEGGDSMEAEGTFACSHCGYSRPHRHDRCLGLPKHTFSDGSVVEHRCRGRSVDGRGLCAGCLALPEPPQTRKGLAAWPTPADSATACKGCGHDRSDHETGRGCKTFAWNSDTRHCGCPEFVPLAVGEWWGGQ